MLGNDNWIAGALINRYTESMHTLKTPHAIVEHDGRFNDIRFILDDAEVPLDLMDIKAVYAAFFLKYLESRIQDLKPDDLINLGYYISKERPIVPL